MDIPLALTALWLTFGGTHLALSSLRLRPTLVSKLSPGGFFGIFSLVALATFVPLAWLYFANKHTGPFLWYLGAAPGLRPIMYVGMGVAFSLAIGGLLRPSPAALRSSTTEARGLLRLTRHPTFMGVGLFGLLHLLVVPVNLAELLFFGGLPLFACIGCAHQDRRKLAEGGETFRRFYDATVFLPFSRPAALPAALREDALVIALGIGATVLVRYFHPTLFNG